LFQATFAPDQGKFRVNNKYPAYKKQAFSISRRAASIVSLKFFPSMSFLAIAAIQTSRGFSNTFYQDVYPPAKRKG
jgi:hypothetical protein